MRSLSLCAWTFAALLTLPALSHAASILGYANGAYGSGNTGLGGDGVSGLNLSASGPATTGIRGINITTTSGSVHLNKSVANINVPAGTIGLSAQTVATANWPTDNRNYYDSAGASINYNGTLNVTSPNNTLANGTPVTVTFSMQVAYLASAVHSVPGGTFASNNNFGQFLIAVGAGAQSSTFVSSIPGPGSFFHMDSNSNKKYETTSTVGPDLTTGIMTTGHLDVVIASRIGDTISFTYNPSVSLYAEVRPYTPAFPTTIASSVNSFAALGLAFGATASSGAAASIIAGEDEFFSVIPDVALIETLSGLEFAPSSNATFANAYAAMPIPEPASAILLTLAALTLPRRRNPRRAA